MQVISSAGGSLMSRNEGSSELQLLLEERKMCAKLQGTTTGLVSVSAGYVMSCLCIL